MKLYGAESFVLRAMDGFFSHFRMMCVKCISPHWKHGVNREQEEKRKQSEIKGNSIENSIEMYKLGMLGFSLAGIVGHSVGGPRMCVCVWMVSVML